MSTTRLTSRPIPRFDRKFFASGASIMRIGDGDIGGKAQGLAAAQELIETIFRGEETGIEVAIPRLAVIATDVFERFVERNDLAEIARSDLPDDRIAHAFQRASLPPEIVGDLRALTEEVRSPLAVRSSSRLEDALFRPFAGVYETKMTPNNQADASERFRKLVEAVKFVWSSTYFRAAKSYIRTTDETIENERMAVVIQEVVGHRRGDRYYPEVSGVCRSYNFYPAARARPEEGVVDLALGLGKTIVDGGLTWSYVPIRPTVPPPFASAKDRMRNTQTTFWAVNMGRPPAFDPVAETEYLLQADLRAAEYDGALEHIASTYRASADRLVPGVPEQGPRVIDFAPLLELRRFGFNDAVRRLLCSCEDAWQMPVEIEFACTLPVGDEQRARLGFLQVRPMVVTEQRVEVTDEDLHAGNLLAGSTRVLGNGVNDRIADVVYVRPQSFDARHCRAIAARLDEINGKLLEADRPYLLIGFGRWGSSDPWLGIPVSWGQVCGARAVIEATLPSMVVELSQGSHFFHNLSSFEVSYFMIPDRAEPGIDWEWLDAKPAVSETEHVRHVRLDRPLLIRVDGRCGRGVIEKDDGRSDGDS